MESAICSQDPLAKGFRLLRRPERGHLNICRAKYEHCRKLPCFHQGSRRFCTNFSRFSGKNTCRNGGVPLARRQLQGEDELPRSKRSVGANFAPQSSKSCRRRRIAWASTARAHSFSAQKAGPGEAPGAPSIAGRNRLDSSSMSCCLLTLRERRSNPSERHLDGRHPLPRAAADGRLSRTKARNAGFLLRDEPGRQPGGDPPQGQ